MQTLLVLGLIPGTHIQITFQGWLDLMEALVFLLALRRLWQHRNTIYIYFTCRQIARLINQYQVLA